ncbi:MAG: hypothetical protein JST54_00275 [Deltaproteobacteria bacterium]|nr:hypothetical protein [Deltaproteobacteria bacterium]
MSGRQQQPEVNRKIVVGWAAGIVLSMVITWRISVALFPSANRHLAAPEFAPAGMISWQPYVSAPPDPLLVSSEHALRSYAWLDAAHSLARVPLARAKAIYLERAEAPDVHEHR